MKTLLFCKDAFRKLQEICERGYPKEVCGLLFSETKQKKISRIEPLENILDGTHSKRLEELLQVGAISISRERSLKGGNFEFVIDPAEHYKKVYELQKIGLDQVGVFHSHPDHPAIPSPTDVSQPFLAGWSNLIVAVHKGQFKEMRSWIRERENSTFQEEKILIE